jgi:glutathione S-transferase
MLEHKGIAYHRADLIPALHKPILRALGFGDTTVPALRMNGRRLQHTLEISRALDDLQPDPPLFPSDPAARAAVQEAERWGEETLQPVPRRLTWWALRRDRSPMRSMAQGARLHVPLGLAIKTAQPIVWIEARINRAGDTAIEADLAALPAMLDHVDALIEDGVLGGASPNAADYPIATSVRLLLCFEDLRPAIDRRRAGDYARAVVPDFPGVIPPVLPADSVANLR